MNNFWSWLKYQKDPIIMGGGRKIYYKRYKKLNKKFIPKVKIYKINKPASTSCKNKASLVG